MGKDAVSFTGFRLVHHEIAVTIWPLCAPRFNINKTAATANLISPHETLIINGEHTVKNQPKVHIA
jgi:hypothetical protein